MTAVTFENKTLTLNDDETLLDGLLRQGEQINYGCKAGACQACIVSVDEGDIPSNCQSGLSDNQKSLNYVLSCQCKPQSPVSVSKIDSEKLAVPCEVIEKSWLNDKVLRIRLSADFDFKPGQYVTLWKDEQIGRAYSIASTPTDGYIECHIKVHENGAFSSWAANELAVGQSINVQGPMGLCFYQAESEQPLLLAAISTGLAPIYGILNKAIESKHKGDINLVVGAKHCDDFYLIQELKELENRIANLSVTFLSQEGESYLTQIADIYIYCQSQLGSLTNHKVYLCGAESFTKKMRKTCFLAGAAMSNIVADSFVAFK